ncbi:MAG: hypothetical protein WA890_13755, partial [Micromonospora sp.]
AERRHATEASGPAPSDAANAGPAPSPAASNRGISRNANRARPGPANRRGPYFASNNANTRARSASPSTRARRNRVPDHPSTTNDRDNSTSNGPVP